MGNVLVDFATIQLKDQGGGVWGSKPGSQPFEVYSDQDYPPIPTYSEDPTYARFLDPNGAGDDGNDGTTWATAWATPTHALEQICAGNGKWLTCRDFAWPLGGIDLTGLGGNGVIDDPIIFRADPVNGCTITDPDGANQFSGIKFDSQNRWLYYGFNLPNSGGFAYYTTGSPTKYHTYRNMTGNLSLIGGAANVFLIGMDGGSVGSGVDYFGAFNHTFSGPGTSVNQNTALIYATKIGNFRIENNVLSNCVHPIKNKHYLTGLPQDGGFIRNNYTIGGLVKTAMSYIEITNNIIDGFLVFEDNGGGDNGGDFNTVSNNTITQNMNFSVSDNIASNNFARNNIMNSLEVYKFSTGVQNTNDTNWSLYASDFQSNSNTYTLPQWQALDGFDLQSIAGSPTFVGGASPTTPSGFALTPASLGYQAGDDGKDMGADTSKVGVFL